MKTLKSLNTNRRKLSEELESAKSTMMTLSRRINELMDLIKETDNDIKSLTTTLVVSEHAIVRYIERVMGISTDDIREAILDESIVAANAKLGNGKFPHIGGFSVVIKDNVVVTVED